MDFFEDDATSQTPPPPPRRPRRNRRRTRIQRLAVLAVIAFVLIFGLAWWIKSCQANAKRSAYRTYFANVSSAIADSNLLGAQLAKFFTQPTYLSTSELTAALNKLQSGQQAIAARVKSASVPGKLSALNSIFVDGMAVRAQGFAQLAQVLPADIAQTKTPSAATITSLSGYFTGPDTYYTTLFYRQARQIMQADGVTDVTVPTMTYYASTSGIFSTASVTTMLTVMRHPSRSGGVHGVALGGVVALPGNTRLVNDGTTQVKASAALSFRVTVQNQGTTAETKVPVTVTLSITGQAPQKLTGTIATLAKGQSQSATVTGFTIPSSAIAQVSTLTVMAGPVPGETVLSNNSGHYKIIFNL